MNVILIYPLLPISQGKATPAEFSSLCRSSQTICKAGRFFNINPTSTDTSYDRELKDIVKSFMQIFLKVLFSTVSMVIINGLKIVLTFHPLPTLPPQGC